MKISSTQRTLQQALRNAPKAPTPSAPTDSLSLSGVLIQRFSTAPVPEQNKLGVLLPAAGGLALGGAAGLIGEGLGAGASLPGIAILGLAGAALGSRIDGGQGNKWTKILAGTGAVIGSAGVVAGALGGVPGAVAGGISLAGPGFALGHLFQHART